MVPVPYIITGIFIMENELWYYQVTVMYENLLKLVTLYKLSLNFLEQKNINWLN